MSDVLFCFLFCSVPIGRMIGRIVNSQMENSIINAMMPIRVDCRHLFLIIHIVIFLVSGFLRSDFNLCSLFIAISIALTICVQCSVTDFSSWISSHRLSFQLWIMWTLFYVVVMDSIWLRDWTYFLCLLFYHSPFSFYVIQILKIKKIISIRKHAQLCLSSMCLLPWFWYVILLLRTLFLLAFSHCTIQYVCISRVEGLTVCHEFYFIFSVVFFSAYRPYRYTVHSAHCAQHIVLLCLL